MSGGSADEIRVFVSGHTPAPALTRWERPDGRPTAIVNSGCWRRQLQPRAGSPRSTALVDEGLGRLLLEPMRHRAHVNLLMNSSALSATSRHPWSIVREWPRFGIFTISVTPVFRFCFL